MENKNNIILVDDCDVGKRLDQYLQICFPDFTRSHIQNTIERGEITLIRGNKILKNTEIKNNKEQENEKIQFNSLKNGEKLKKNDKISYFFEKPREINLKPENLLLDIVYEDDDLAVINKPQGLVVHPCISCPNKTLVNGLLFQIKNLSGINGEIRPGIVHRIDKDTCGLLLVAKNDKAHVDLSRQIASKTCSRKYLALIENTFKEESGTITTQIDRDKKDRKKMAVVSSGGRIAITQYKTKEIFDKYSLVEFSLKTGRTHQIRVHAKYLNRPIVGDVLYGNKDKFGLKGQFLCAYKISFIQPTTKEKMEFEIELPQDFQNILKSLKNKNN
ncbi:MAG: RluA family pseudouridine synthase [Clostridia bacterium]|nr:RluA family pseudouridine synthase [Clostridia bacterium]